MKRAEAIPRQALHGFLRIVVALLWATPWCARVAYADVVMAPSPDGYFGAWLACPIGGETVDAAAIAPRSGAPLSDGLRWIKWSVVDGGAGTFDLNRAFGERRTKRLLLGSILALAEPLDALALISVDGTASLLVDGKVVWSRDKPHARGKAWDPVPFSLPAGDHVVALDLGRSGPAWSLDVRLLSAADLEPPLRATWRLPGASEDDARRLATRLARIEAASGLVPLGYQPRVRIEFPRGAPTEPPIPLAATLVRGKAPTGATQDLGKIPFGRRGVEVIEQTMPALSMTDLKGASLPNGLSVRVGSASKTLPLVFDPEAPPAFEGSLSLGRALQSQKVESADRDVALATLARASMDLGSRLDAGDPSASGARKRLADFVASYESGKDPLRAPGVLDLGRYSSLDGAPQPLELHVPAGYEARGSTRYPLLVLLHGYDGTPERIMTAFLGSDSKRPHPAINGFVVAPGGHGNAFYRGPGETEVMETIDWVVTHYPIDPDRITIAGHSMGGTGAAELAFRRPDRFAAISALAGYHSYFVRRDVQGRPLRAWEWAELVRYSPASFAENGRDIPLYVAQGTNDLPLAHSEALVDRYRSLGQTVVAEWPEIGHDVWRIAWSGGKQWATLAARRSVRSPKRVTLTSDSLAAAKRAWVELVSPERAGFPATIDATIAGPDRIVVKATATAALRLDRPEPHLREGTPVTVAVNGNELTFEGTERLEAHRSGGAWAKGPLPPEPGSPKRAGIEGPIRDAFRGPLAFVYGTQDLGQARAAREVAEHFRARYAGDARFPVLADVAVPKRLASTHSLFLVGSVAANGLRKSLEARLPLGMTRGGVRLGARIVSGDAELGLICIYPNPENPSRYVVTVEANDARGLYRSMSLPMQLPDFVVYDSRVGAAAGQQVLGEAQVLAAGYFDRNWALPADPADVIAVPAGRDGARFRPE